MEIDAAILLIRISIGLVMVSFGLSQFFNPQGWFAYIPRWLAFILPSSRQTTMRLHALGNFVLGALFLSGVWPMVMAWIVGLWWLSILPLAYIYDRYVALRDVAIICAIVALILLLRV